MKYNIITHITTSCNYNCSYCDVIKDWKKIGIKNRDYIIDFIKKNSNNIWDFKFFWWEPLLEFNNIKYIIDNSKKDIWKDFFEIVTNTSLIERQHLDYFINNFKIIYFSVDNENKFNYELFLDIIHNYNILKEKIFINLIIDPWKITECRDTFRKLYNMWFKWYNLLPVYFTKVWMKEQLLELSVFVKEILDLSLEDNEMKMYGFSKDKWDESKLSYNSLFIETDLKIYYSDMVSTYMWKNLKDKLYVWDTKTQLLYKISEIYIEKKKEILYKKELYVTNSLIWQRELHKIMDYFSKYLNSKNGK